MSELDDNPIVLIANEDIIDFRQRLFFVAVMITRKDNPNDVEVVHRFAPGHGQDEVRTLILRDLEQQFKATHDLRSCMMQDITDEMVDLMRLIER